MHKGRLEAFSDGVVAILITIMVLELGRAAYGRLAALVPLVPMLLSYLLSFVFLAIYWNNHHHMLQAAHHVDGGVLWANLHLLFWLSLVPFATAWIGHEHLAPWPVAAYGIVLLCCGMAYLLLSRCLIAVNGDDSPLARAVGDDRKGLVSLGLYATAIPLAFCARSCRARSTCWSRSSGWFPTGASSARSRPSDAPAPGRSVLDHVGRTPLVAAAPRRARAAGTRAREVRAPEPRRQREGPDRASRSSTTPSARRARPGRHDHRGDRRQHRGRARAGRRGARLPRSCA